MVAWHGRYDLGDAADKIEKSTGMHKPSADDFQEWAKTAPEMRGALIIPLFVYEHGGITMRAGTGFSCPWDSGQVGWIYFTRAEMLKEWGRGKRVTKKTRDAARAYAMAAVEEYADYLEGNVYGYIVREREEEDGTPSHGDSCWGFIGRKYVIEEARRALGYAIRERRKAKREEAAAAVLRAQMVCMSA